MLAHMRKHPIKSGEHLIYMHHGIHTYAIPESIANQYLVQQVDNESISAHEIFKDLDIHLTEAGALLRGVRARENLTQVEFAKAIGVSQVNLSKMEHGKRPIGKQIAKRIEQVFGVNYKYFLG